MSNKKNLEQTKAKVEIVFDLMVGAITDYTDTHKDAGINDADVVNASLSLIIMMVAHHNNNDPVKIRKALDIMVEGIIRQTRENNLNAVK